MGPLQTEEWAILMSYSDVCHHRALAEKAADVAVETRQTDPAKAPLRAQLAVDIAERVAGNESWKARIRAYAVAALGQVLVGAGALEAAEEAQSEVVRLWKVGEEEPEPLLGERFLGWVGSRDGETRAYCWTATIPGCGGRVGRC